MKSSNHVAQRGPLSFGGVLIASVMVAALSFGASVSALAQGALQVRVLREGPAYTPVPDVASDQSQVIVFRSTAATPSAPGAAHVYINGSFHNGLMLGNYTRFCVNQGILTVEAYVGDAPTYAGKSAPKRLMNLEGGKTYFMNVQENGAGALTPYSRVEAEPMLAGLRQPHHVINRAAAVVPCNEVTSVPVQIQAPKQERFTLNADVLFAFGKGDYAAITSEGRGELKRLATDLHARHKGSLSRIIVRGYTDPIGAAASNEKLSQLRAQTVSRILQEEGLSGERVTAEGKGSVDLVVNCPNGGQQEKIACNAPNRRVEVIAQNAN